MNIGRLIRIVLFGVKKYAPEDSMRNSASEALKNRLIKGYITLGDRVNVKRVSFSIETEVCGVTQILSQEIDMTQFSEDYYKYWIKQILQMEENEITE